ncbi:alpha/beta hydrolase family protein [Ideonella sp. BN130291]|uniref:alpha/beta hydrolase family protein n=1 Tax=Ideonella sp. BN130291 TaxID=3112940 RepID=UPI002E268D0E|nr:alpha/beta hydrolase [Ideonella sp. BN130291]
MHRTASPYRCSALVTLAASLALLAGCGGGDDDDDTPAPEESRPQDALTFTPVVETSFAALAGSAVETDRWTGVLNGAAYRIEVPKTGWNGKLVMWAHGYAGSGPNLTVGTPIMRRYLLDNGYAWAASSYSKNNYDVRAGIEDTNALALNFVSIAGSKGRTLAAPSKIFITGVSMGGHITAAAIEAETETTAVHKVHYHGAVPLCGVVGDNELFNYFAGYQVAAQQLAGVPMTSFPVTNFATLAPAIQSALWTTFPTQTNAQGDKLKNVVMNLSGGARPFYAEGWANAGNQGNIWASLGGDGTISGILNKNVLDTTGLYYKVDASSTDKTALDDAFNASAFKITPAPDANRLRRDGLRWIPVVNGEFSVPVVSLHTLGDLFVPFRMEQVYHDRAKAKGNDQRLVQRAIRDVGHCAFTAAEATTAFDDMVKWEAGGAKPAGDDVATAATVASPTYGCAFTNNTPSTEDYTAPDVRAAFQAHYPACP